MADQVLRHVVLFKFKDSAAPADVQQIEEAFRALPAQIDVIQEFEWGTDVSVEGKAEGYTHCFFVTFADAAGRDAYLPHPAHQAFGQVLRPHLDKVLVFDYWASDQA
ncbi:MAG: Dabb family protein [Caldilineaceae bacterium]|nr:Dabb family protein [Caldilineaceae bacterium]